MAHVRTIVRSGLLRWRTMPDVDCVEDNNCKQDEYREDNRCLPAVTACADGDGDGYGVARTA